MQVPSIGRPATLPDDRPASAAFIVVSKITGTINGSYTLPQGHTAGQWPQWAYERLRVPLDHQYRHGTKCEPEDAP